VNAVAQPAGAGLVGRLAGAPISWGVCEVPGWGVTLDPETVFSEMAALGLTGTELGPVGYLPADPAELRRALARHGLDPVAAFVPVVFDPGLGSAALAATLDAADSLAAVGGRLLMVAAIADSAWSRHRPSGTELAELARGLDELGEAVVGRGLLMAVHPHVGSLIERAQEIEALLGLTSVEWCLDTGHLLIGGVDPVGFARAHGDRVAHVHLKDVDADLAAEVAAGRMSLPEATRRRLFRPLGDGDGEIAAAVAELGRQGYGGWLTLEQDTMLDSPGAAAPSADVARSIEFIRALDRGRR
jgi:inosose dehydratase